MHPIGKYRHAKGWTQGALAKEIEVSTNTVASWERGVTPRPSTLVKLARALAVDPLQLLNEIEHWKTTEGKVAA